MNKLSLFGLAILCILACRVSGGAVRSKSNFNEKSEDSSAELPQWLRSTILTLKSFVLKQTPSEDTLENSRKATKEGAYTATLPHNDVELTRIDMGNPFIRTKRAVCSLPDNLPLMISEFNSQLNSSQLIGKDPQEQPRVNITAQKDFFNSNQTPDWWPGAEDNLRSTCPWKYIEIDLGADAFPRYIKTAECLCPYCISATTMGCQEIRQNITYFVREGCRNGIAKMNTRYYTASVGCTCIAASQQIKTTLSPKTTQKSTRALSDE